MGLEIGQHRRESAPRGWVSDKVTRSGVVSWAGLTLHQNTGLELKRVGGLITRVVLHFHSWVPEPRVKPTESDLSHQF